MILGLNVEISAVHIVIYPPESLFLSSVETLSIKVESETDAYSPYHNHPSSFKLTMYLQIRHISPEFITDESVLLTHKLQRIVDQ